MNCDIYIYGSVSRGEISSDSDIDVLVVPSEPDTKENIPEGWSLYQRPTLEGYFNSGHLFAWHLYLESKCVFSYAGGGFLKTLGQPQPYISAKPDIETLRGLLIDSVNEISSKTNSPIYELGLIHTAIRDIAMCASLKLTGSHAFSKWTPYTLPIICPLERSVYEALMHARHASTRTGTYNHNIEHVIKNLRPNELIEWVDQIIYKI